MEIINKVRLLLKVNWIRTFAFNFKHLPFVQARHLPILLYHPGRICGSGSYVLEVPTKRIKFGMLKLGVKNENSILTKTGISISNNGKIIFRGSGVIGNGSSITVSNGGVLSLGENFGITGDVSFHCSESISIGRFFSCSWDVSIDDSDHHQLFDLDNNCVKQTTKPISIGDFVWLCQKVTLLKGVVLPDWTTVSSNSLVNRKYLTPPSAVLAGVPAKDTGKKIRRMDIESFASIKDWYITEGLKVFNC